MCVQGRRPALPVGAVEVPLAANRSAACSADEGWRACRWPASWNSDGGQPAAGDLLTATTAAPAAVCCRCLHRVIGVLLLQQAHWTRGGPPGSGVPPQGVVKRCGARGSSTAAERGARAPAAGVAEEGVCGGGGLAQKTTELVSTTAIPQG